MATKAKFAVGDIVKLKSGGPEMTVQSLPPSANDYYYCRGLLGKSLSKAAFRPTPLNLLSQRTSNGS